jgi:hypothetical protein
MACGYDERARPAEDAQNHEHAQDVYGRAYAYAWAAKTKSAHA